MIEVKNINFAYGKETLILKDISFHLKKGDFLTLLGHNGAGKSTLLHLIMGWLRLKSGEISVTTDPSKIFLLQESGGYYKELTIKENINFRFLLNKLTSPKNLVENELIQSFKLEKYINKPIKELSQGLKKRFYFVMGIMFNPDLILLDEPTNSVDPVTREILVSNLVRLKSEGKTILLVTHDLEFSYSLTDRLIIINNGEKVLDAVKPDDFSHYKQDYLDYAREI